MKNIRLNSLGQVQLKCTQGSNIHITKKHQSGSNVSCERTAPTACCSPDNTNGGSSATQNLVKASQSTNNKSNVSEEDNSSIRVAFQGVSGAYSEQATQLAVPGCSPVPCQSFDAVFVALMEGAVDRACLPVENSLGGSIHAVYDLIVQQQYCHVIAEVYLPVHHCLLALPGQSMDDITVAMSHPQALAQTRNYLQRHNITAEGTYDTAGAAQTVATEQLRGVAAVASKLAAELYGLEIIEEGIQDNKFNFTRFLLLSREPSQLPSVSTATSSRQYKTSVVWSIQPGNGALYRALSCFAIRNIDMTKIESRPLAGGGPGSNVRNGLNGGYSLYVDFQGSVADNKVQTALRRLQWEHAPDLSVLGSYKMQDAQAAKPPPAAARPQLDMTSRPFVSTMDLSHYLADTWHHLERPSMGKKPRVAYFGSHGSFGWQATNALFPGCQTLSRNTFEAAFSSMSQWQADLCVVPIESDVWGSVHRVYDLLIQYELHIVGEVSLQTPYCIAGLPGSDVANISTVVGHELSMGQCQRYLRQQSWKQRPNQKVSGDNVKELKGSVGAVEGGGGEAESEYSAHGSEVAIVTNRQVAENEGLEVLVDSIQDAPKNHTRFIVLSRTPTYVMNGIQLGAFKPQNAGGNTPTPASPATFVSNINDTYAQTQPTHKTSIVFSLNNGPGVLYTAMSVFASRNIDVNKVESRPLRLSPLVQIWDGPDGQQQFNYLFYVDLLCSLRDQSAKFALMDLADLAPYLRVLGSYKLQRRPGESPREQTEK